MIMKKLTTYLSALLLAGVLAGCNLTNILPTPDLAITLLGPSSSGVQEDATEGSVSELIVYTVNTRNTETNTIISTNRFLPLVRLQVQARPGSIGAYIESYSVDYFLADGTQVLSDNNQSYRGVVQLVVPDGVICREVRSEEEPIDCDINDYDPTNPSRDFEYAMGDPVISQNFSPISSEIANSLTGETGAFASIVVEGRDANNRSFSQRLTPVKVNFFSEEVLFEPEPEPEDEEEPADSTT